MPASLTDIRLFVAAYEERSFTAAAQRENATQSGVSQHVAKLERRARRRAVRARQGPHRADAGRPSLLCALPRRAARLRGGGRQRRSARRAAVGRDLDRPDADHDALGAGAGAGAASPREHPNVAVKVVEAYSGALTREVRAGVFDFAIVPAFAGGAGPARAAVPDDAGDARLAQARRADAGACASGAGPTCRPRPAQARAARA